MTSDVPATPVNRAGPSGLPGLAEGTELAGEFVGAGYKEPPLLVYRGDGQVVRLPELLYQTVRALDDCQRLGDPAAGRRPFTSRMRLLAAVAGHLSAQAGREYAAEHVEFLLDKKLAPLGVTTYSDGTPPELVKPQPMLSLTCRTTMLSERSTWFLAGLFTWLFSKPVLAAMIPLILGAASWTLITQPIAAAVEVTIGSPASILLVVALAIASTAFHEIGHGTACRYGGVRPGVTGCGLYLAWPVFFTDITNTYRMGRGGRLRADLGGVYFNGIFLLVLTVGYVASGRPAVLLAAILSTSLEAFQQLLPTLRFDGYYIIADLVGIPDLFKYIGPIIHRVLLRRPDDGRLAALKRWPQTVVTIWVLLVVPVLVAQLSLLAYNFPGIVRSDWTGVHVLAAHSLSGGNPVLTVASAVVQILLLLFPLAGMTLIAFRLLRGLVRMIAKRLHTAGLVDLTALAGVWGISWFLGLQGTRPATEATTVGVDSLLESGSAPDDDAADDPDRKRLWLVDDDDLPAPRHRSPQRSRRPGMMPVLGAAGALGLVVVLAWTLMPSSRQGKAADLQPNKVIGVPSTGRPAHPGGQPAPSPGSGPSSGYRYPGSSQYPESQYPASGYPGKGEGGAPSSTYGWHGSGSYGPGWRGTGSYGSGAGSGSGAGPEGSGAGAAPSSGTGGAGTGQPSSGGPASPGQSSPGQSSPGQSSSAGASPDQPANGMAPAAPAAGQPSGGQPASGPAQGQTSSAQPSGASPSPGQSSAAPSSSARWSPEATGPSQGSPSGSSQPSSPSPPGSGSPSPSGSQTPSGSQSPFSPSGAPQSPVSGSPSPSGSPGAPLGTPEAACRAPVGGMLLTLIGLCPH